MDFTTLQTLGNIEQTFRGILEHSIVVRAATTARDRTIHEGYVTLTTSLKKSAMHESNEIGRIERVDYGENFPRRKGMLET